MPLSKCLHSFGFLGKEKNFRKKPRENAQFLGTAYDYSSIMHYDKGAFAKGRSLVTIKPIGNDTAKIGLVSDLSAVDWQEVNSLYQCHCELPSFVYLNI